ncbi:MAG: hypothetical protein ACKPBU_05785 [Alphaproteobacteria bacterium]
MVDARGWVIAGVAAATLLGCADAALANGPRPGGRPAEGEPIRDPACVSDCREVAECRNEAFDTARGCAAAACPSESEAYESACSTTPQPTEECRSARGALLSCAAPCWEELEVANAACGQKLDSCLAGCAAIDRSGKDSVCATSCLSGGRTCARPARKAVGKCHASSGCRDLRAAARAACRADRTSEVCASARDAARACFRSCRALYFDATADCFDTTKSCVDACPETVAESGEGG